MPLYYFLCADCKKESGILRTPTEITQISEIPCKCGGTAHRNPHPPTSPTVMESLDNGVMAKRVVRLADAERLFKERNREIRKKEEGEE